MWCLKTCFRAPNCMNRWLAVSWRASLCFCPPFFLISIINSCSNGMIFPTISFVGLNHFTITKHSLELWAKDGDVWIIDTRKRSIDMDNVISPDGKINLVSKSRAFELVRLPPTVEWRWFIDLEVGTINRNQAVSVILSTIWLSVAPFDLQWHKQATEETVRIKRPNWQDRWQSWSSSGNS